MKKFWEQDTTLSPISATRALISGMHNKKASVVTKEGLGAAAAAEGPNSIVSKQAMLGQIATRIANAAHM